MGRSPISAYNHQGELLPWRIVRKPLPEFEPIIGGKARPTIALKAAFNNLSTAKEQL